MKRTYKYETHMHTSEASACAKCSGYEMATKYKEMGYDGIIITDHFFNGNTCIPRNMPWEERIERFSQGYENALEQGAKIGLKVFFGWEFNNRCTEFLTYGLDKKWLLSNPDILKWDLNQYFEKVHADGGFISHAHPFREAPYIPEIRLFPNDVDAVEVINTSHVDSRFNKLALEYANKYALPNLSGSDAHTTKQEIWGGVEFDYELNSIEDFINAVKTKSYNVLGK